MIVLALDTSLPACTVALVETGPTPRLIGAATTPMATGHAEALMPMVAAVLAEAGVAIDAVDAFAGTVGPGSFTGVRVGLAATQGLARATGRPVLGISTLAALAWTCRSRNGPQPVAAAIDARRGEVYLQSFAADGSPLDAPRAVRVDEAAAALPADLGTVFGSGAPLLAAAAGDRLLCVAGEDVAPSPDGLAAAVDPEGAPPRPLYLRPPDAKPQQGKTLARL